MEEDYQISVVIPTCDRKASLLRLLKSLQRSLHTLCEVIIVDSGNDQLSLEEINLFPELKIKVCPSVRSVCVQRNIGIKQAASPWIFLCDDDLEVSGNYLSLLIHHIKSNLDVGAVSGLVLQKQDEVWEEQYPITSSAQLFWRFIFQLSIWGEIRCKEKNFIINAIRQYYRRKGNHLSKAGWPVVTEFSGDYFTTPVYGLGASLVKKEWLVSSPYDELLDAHGIGDNYGVAVGFPTLGVHVLKNAFVYHHQESQNRLPEETRYFRRVLALDYFLKSRPSLKFVSSGWFLCSLIGNLAAHVKSGNKRLIKAAYKSLLLIIFRRNPYVSGAKSKKIIIEPSL